MGDRERQKALGQDLRHLAGRHLAHTLLRGFLRDTSGRGSNGSKPNWLLNDTLFGWAMRLLHRHVRSGKTKRGNRMNRRDILTATGAAMIASQLPARAAGGNWDKARREQAAGVMADWIKDGRVEGASILVTQGSRQFARNFGTAKGSEPVFLLASITKPMTATAVMTLVDAGELSLDDKAVKFFPAFTGEGRETITIRNLLTHTGGLPDMLADDEMLREHHAPLSD